MRSRLLLTVAASLFVCSGLALAQSTPAAHELKEQKKNSQSVKGTKGTPITGKTSVHGVENPVTTTKSPDANTPGIDTEAGRAQGPGPSRDVPVTDPANLHQRTGGASPPDIAEAGQAQKTADTNAVAAGRAEIVPGNTLGVSNSPTSTQPAAQSRAGTNAQQARPRKTPQRRKSTTNTTTPQ